MARATAEVATTTTITNALGRDGRLTANATLVATLVTPGAHNPPPPATRPPKQLEDCTPDEQKIIKDINDDLNKVLEAIDTLSQKQILKDEADRNRITNDAVKRSIIFAMVRLSMVPQWEAEDLVAYPGVLRVLQKDKVKHKLTQRVHVFHEVD